MSVKPEKPEKIQLTRAQRRGLFVVGAFHTKRAHGTWGKRIRREVWEKLECQLEWVCFDLTCCRHDLTEAGRARFDAEFGAPCPEHGWRVAADSLRGEYRRCVACRAVHERVCGYELAPALLLWERKALQAVTVGNRDYFQDADHHLVRQKLMSDGLIEADGTALTQEGCALLADNPDTRSDDMPKQTRRDRAGEKPRPQEDPRPWWTQGPLSDEQSAALEHYEHALDCDRPDHSRCDIDTP